MPKYVILDIDGTLMDTNYMYTEAWARALAGVGREVPRWQIHRQVGKSSDLLIGEFSDGGGETERVHELHGEAYDALQEYAHPLPGAI
jgi:beta-phosphoglucomutase-like phosphatase (HAD superfamily)